MYYSKQQLEIIELCKSGEWVCHESLKKLMWNEHKRRGEIRDKGEYRFEDIPCVHGIKRTKDYRMLKVEIPKEEKVQLSFSYKISETQKVWRL